MSIHEPLAIVQTKNWINKVVIGCNFCPFAAKVMSISEQAVFEIIDIHDPNPFDVYLNNKFSLLDSNNSIETFFILFPDSLSDFEHFLDIIELANEILNQSNKEGIYQLASFHPSYRFEGTAEDDPSNYTNRSLYPMIQILREESITKVKESYADIESIPNRNIEYTRTKGLDAMIALRTSCL